MQSFGARNPPSAQCTASMVREGGWRLARKDGALGLFDHSCNLNPRGISIKTSGPRETCRPRRTSRAWDLRFHLQTNFYKRTNGKRYVHTSQDVLSGSPEPPVPWRSLPFARVRDKRLARHDAKDELKGPNSENAEVAQRPEFSRG